jgi:chromosomal replication initiator protein
MHTFARWVSTPENRSAHLAVQGVLDAVCSRQPRRVCNPLFLHGPPGTGKTHLVSVLVAEATRRCPDLVVSVLSAGDLDMRPGLATDDGPPEGVASLDAARDSDLLVLEDLQRLSPQAAETLVPFVDDRLGRRQQTVLTATVGPGQLRDLPARLTSRLASGLVVGLEPLSPASRLALLQDGVGRRQLAVAPDVLAWLAEHLPGSGRAVEGALARLEMLARLHDRPLTLAAVAEHFRPEAETTRPTVERIVQRVSGYFQVEPRQLCSRHRHRQTLLPRQVGMYLARQLTPLSLEQIGAYFGGRDHSTVLHACRKVEDALARDAALSGAVRRLHADLT